MGTYKGNEGKIRTALATEALPEEEPPEDERDILTQEHALIDPPLAVNFTAFVEELEHIVRPSDGVDERLALVMGLLNFSPDMVIETMEVEQFAAYMSNVLRIGARAGRRMELNVPDGLPLHEAIQQFLERLRTDSDASAAFYYAVATLLEEARTHQELGRFFANTPKPGPATCAQCLNACACHNLSGQVPCQTTSPIAISL